MTFKYNRSALVVLCLVSLSGTPVFAGEVVLDAGYYEAAKELVSTCASHASTFVAANKVISAAVPVTISAIIAAKVFWSHYCYVSDLSGRLDKTSERLARLEVLGEQTKVAVDKINDMQFPEVRQTLASMRTEIFGNHLQLSTAIRIAEDNSQKSFGELKTDVKEILICVRQIAPMAKFLKSLPRHVVSEEID